MKHLSAPQQVELTRWKEKFRDSAKEARDAIATANEKLEAHNALLKEAESWLDPIRDAIADHFANAEEEWQESDEGQAYDDWKCMWEEATFEPTDLLEGIFLDDPLADLTNEP